MSDLTRYEMFPAPARSTDEEKLKALEAAPYSRPTGQQIFDAMTREEQDAQFGPEKAEALRTGTLELADLVDRSPQATADDFITAKSSVDLGIKPKDKT